MIVAIIIILYLYHNHLVPTSSTPITKEQFQLIAQLFIDNTELNIENDRNENEGEVIDRAQSTLTAWHQALIFTGGQFKLVKLY